MGLACVKGLLACASRFAPSTHAARHVALELATGRGVGPWAPVIPFKRGPNKAAANSACRRSD